ncbi:hypothetical protein QU487_13395 [Crenobacter sp. SG2305]|uniref:hypothetical protein n=1 Tax=Crenobacter oryzisoli TaxID=3056844 RepID=UPI0025AB16B0|nr:hypothetical protein [Crenobacter sp. SG2305]MDN0083742.1 hypothetical protein [Crenobacter sp. SG2305]
MLEAGAALYEYRKKSYRVGGAVRVARGVYIGASEPISHDELRQVASGAIALTNQRLVFLSSQRTTSIEHADVLSLDSSGTSLIQIHTAKRKTPVILTVSDHDAALLVLLIKLFSAGNFDSRYLPDGLVIEPVHNGSGDVSVNVRQGASGLELTR